MNPARPQLGISFLFRITFCTLSDLLVNLPCIHTSYVTGSGCEVALQAVTCNIALHCFAFLCIALLCFASLCFICCCFALLCFALLFIALHHILLATTVQHFHASTVQHSSYPMSAHRFHGAWAMHSCTRMSGSNVLAARRWHRRACVRQKGFATLLAASHVFATSVTRSVPPLLLNRCWFCNTAYDCALSIALCSLMDVLSNCVIRYFACWRRAVSGNVSLISSSSRMVFQQTCSDVACMISCNCIMWF